MLPDVETSIIIMELERRLGDTLYDPDPKFDLALDGVDIEFLVVLHEMLSMFTKKPEEVNYVSH